MQPINEKPVRALLVDDDEEEYFLMKEMLSDADTHWMTLSWEPEYEGALRAIREGAYDIYLIDYNLGGRSGLDLLQEVSVSVLEAPIIMITGQGGREVDLLAMKAGASDYLVKGEFNVYLLERSIRYAMERSRLLGELKEHDRVMSRDLQMAQQIQERFLPQTFPFSDRMQFAAYYKACSLIGGDLYGAFGFREGLAGFHMADVSGHGVSAALISAILKVSVDQCRDALRAGLLQSAAGNNHRDLGAFLERFMMDLNQSMGSILHPARFVTFLIGLCCVHTGELCLANAGHTRPLIWRAGESRVEVLEPPTNLPLGVLREFPFQAAKAQMSPMDKIIIYTDGVIERLNEEGEEFGMTRFVETLQEHGNQPPQDLIKIMRNRLDTFGGAQPPSDDQSLLIMEYLPPPGSPREK